jgi:hypothetical protein
VPGALWKSCGRIVDCLWTCCDDISIFIIGPNKLGGPHTPGAASHALSLASNLPATRISRAVALMGGAPRTAVNALRINETINGRSYVIEVRPVGRDRWRAELARRGVTTALMPFYGTTPEAAAEQLLTWLTRANRVPQRA